MKTLLIACLLLLAGPALAQKIYKWTDSQGVVHYSSQPNEQAREFRVSRSVDPPPAPAEAEPTEPEPPAAEPSGPSPQQIAARRQTLCERGRNLVAQIEPRARLSEIGPDGQIRGLSDEERMQRLSDARELVADNCR